MRLLQIQLNQEQDRCLMADDHPVSWDPSRSGRIGCISSPGLSEWPLGHPREVSTHKHPRTQGDMPGLLHFAEMLRDSVVTDFSDNTTALAYLSREGGTHSILFS